MGQLTMQTVEAKGARIPIIGFGTWQLRGPDCVRLTQEALRLGCRHLDTAQAYENEAEVGEGLKASGLPRSSPPR
jgi:2,5-diketo-D-gluconate reductase B